VSLSDEALKGLLSPLNAGLDDEEEEVYRL
jgi:hypothetical protein